MTETTALYDLNSLKENSLGDDDFLRDMIVMFKESGIANLEILSKNCMAGPCHDWVEAAHSLKGGAGMIGAETLRNLAAIAQAADDTTAEHRLEMFNQMKDLYTKICDALVQDGLLS